MTHVRARWSTGLVLSAAVVLAACGGSSDGGSAGPTSTAKAASAAVDRSGELTVLITQAPNTLDPAKATTVAPYPYQLEIYDRLVQRDVHNDLKPMLAKDWRFSSDGLSLTMDLRDDVTFNDGAKLTSADVKATIERNKTLAGSAWAVALAPVESVEAPAPDEVVLHLSRPAGDLPAVLSTPAGAIINAKVIAEGRSLDTNPGRDAGSGPRVVESMVVNDRVVYVRADDDYWDPAANKLAKVTIARVADANARLNALRAGQADLVTVKQETASAAKALAEQPGFGYHELPGVQQNAIFLNASRPPLDKLEVRQAINLAIDRNAISSFLGGDCPPATQLFQKGLPGFETSLQKVDHDPAQAKKLLAEAGLPTGFTLHLSIPAGLSPYGDVASILQEQLAKVGIKVEVASVDAPTINPQYNAGGVDAMLNVVTTQPDPGQVVDLYLLGGAKVAGAQTDAVAALAAKAKDRTGADWKAAYQDIAKLVQDNALYAPVCNGKAQYLFNDKVVGVDTMAGQLLAASVETRYLGIAADR